MKTKSSASETIRKLLTEKIIYVVLVVLIIAIICIEPRFLSVSNFSNILAQSSTRIIIALGAGMVVMVRGCDLSTGRMIGLAAVISASLLQDVNYAYRMYQNLPQLPIIVPLLLVVALCALLGMISGICVAQLKVPPIIATLAMQLVLYGASSIYFDRPPYGAQPIGGITSHLTKLCTGGIKIGSFRLPYLTIIAIAVIAFMWVLWNKTKFGKYVYAVGGNPEAAQVSGVNVKKILIETYALAAVMYGIPRKAAYEMVSAMIEGNAALQLSSGRHPGEMKDEVCSPGGSTIRGVAALEEKGLRAAVIAAIKAIQEK